MKLYSVLKRVLLCKPSGTFNDDRLTTFKCLNLKDIIAPNGA